MYHKFLWRKLPQMLFKKEDSLILSLYSSKEPEKMTPCEPEFTQGFFDSNKRHPQLFTSNLVLNLKPSYTIEHI